NAGATNSCNDGGWIRTGASRSGARAAAVLSGSTRTAQTQQSRTVIRDRLSGNQAVLTSVFGNMATTVLEKPTQRESLATSGMAFVWAIAVAKLLFHIYFNNRYGYFRDEFDYIACARHLAWGYVDQPPLVPFLA